MKSIKGTRTEENLRKAFAGESQARNKYTFFAERARRDGYEQIAGIFEQAAAHEKQHAKKAYRLLEEMGDTSANLELAAQGENYEHTDMYPEFEKIAREEGLDEIADFFKGVAEAESEHERRFLTLKERVDSGTVFERDDDGTCWHCRNCGCIQMGQLPPDRCPVCDHPRSFFEINFENF